MSGLMPGTEMNAGFDGGHAQLHAVARPGPGFGENLPPLHRIFLETSHSDNVPLH